jgi:hypothetical protein
MKPTAIVLLALSLAGCGRASHALPSPPSGRPVQVGLSAVRASRDDMRCRSSELRLRAGPLVSEATEQDTRVLVLTNLAGHDCVLRGYPTVTLLDGRGRVLRFVYRRHGDQELTGRVPRWVRLRPGGSAYLAVNKNSCVGFSRSAAAGIRVTLPRASAVLSLTLRRYSRLDYCGRGDPGHIVDVAPIEPTLSSVFARW